MIKDAIANLDLKNRRILDYAFNHKLSQMVKNRDSTRFVGVNIQESPDIIIEEKVGVWSCGKVK